MLSNHKEISQANGVLLISCADRKGITAAVTNFIFEHNGNIISADQHIDDQTNTFFMRIEWSMGEFNLAKDEIPGAFDVISDKYQMKWELYFTDEPPRIALFVSKHLHCLVDLLFRQMAGHFACEIGLIISNHSHARAVAEEFDIEFHQIEITPDTKADQEAKQIELLRQHNIDLIILTRYHQILSPGFIQHYRDRIINIHHSFLPAFKGANPYAQAYAKGVKLIGATSHFVTEELDAGPIIVQDTIAVSHRDTLQDMVRKGEDLEKIVLSRAVRLALDWKILRYGNKTVVFE